MTKTIAMLVLGLLGLSLLVNTLYYFGKKTSSIDLPNMISIVSLAGNFIMILLMFVTIFISDKSLQESTRRTIKAFKEEISKQIESYQATSNEQINELKRAEKEQKRVSLITLRKEIELNHAFILSAIVSKKDYAEGNSFMLKTFKTAAYEQGMVTNYITDEDLINKILLFYSDMYTANELNKMVINTNIIPLTNKKETISSYNQLIIGLSEKNKDISSDIVNRLIEIEKELKNK